jgi:hypothetical protein
MMCCYVGEFLGRLVTSLNSLKALEDYHTKLEDIIYQPGDTSLKIYLPEIYYPFQPGYINLTSLCWAIVYISATRAYFGSRIAAYKTAAAGSLLFFLTNTSSMFYVMALYYDMDLWKDSVCFNYFQDRKSPPASLSASLSLVVSPHSYPQHNMPLCISTPMIIKQRSIVKGLGSPLSSRYRQPLC